jgi:hypothetical protein
MLRKYHSKRGCPNIRGVLQNIHSFNLLDLEFLCEYERVRLRQSKVEAWVCAAEMNCSDFMGLWVVADLWRKG